MSKTKTAIKEEKLNLDKKDLYLKGDSSEDMLSSKVSHIDQVNLFEKFDNSNIKRAKRSIFHDRMFKTMFCNTKRKVYVAYFLSFLIDMPYEQILSKMEFFKGEFDIEKVADKNCRGDLVIKIDNTLINIEVNNSDSLRRNLDYMERLAKTEVKSGSPYAYYRVIAVNLNNFTREGVGVYDISRRINSHGKMPIYKVSLDIYVPKIKNKLYNKDSLNDLEKSILIMAMTDEKDIQALAEGDEIMKRYIEESNQVLEDDLLESYDHIQDVIDGEIAYQKEIMQIELKEKIQSEEHRLNAEKEKLGAEKEKLGAEKEKLKHEKLETAKIMFNKGINLDTIIECFKFSANEIEKLKLML